MKIGILTLPLHTNYGGILQAYALQTVLERMGHEVEILDRPMYKTSPFVLVRPLIYLKRIIRKMRGDYKGAILTTNQNKRIKMAQIYTRPFINQYIHRAEVSSLKKCTKFNFDAFVVGSDQIWRALYFRSLWNTDMTDAFLGFCNDNTKRIAYSASFGTEEWEFTKKETKKCINLIQKFSAVSTREISGIQLCKKHLKFNNCEHTLDPTMLLSKEYYINLFEKNKIPKSEGTLLYYILDENDEKTNLIKKISKEKEMLPFRVNSRTEDLSAPLKECCQPPVEQWIRGFYDAEFVITDSFHACIFSILFNKPFIVISNAKRGLSRFTSLLETFGLEQCLITLPNDYNSLCLKDFDWDKINTKLQNEQKRCLDYIQKGLE